MPLSLLTQLRKNKEDELESRAKDIKAKTKGNSNPNDPMTITNSGKRYKDKSNKTL